MDVAPEADELDIAVAEELYRIALQALSNATEHGRPSRIDVRLEADNGDLTLIVDDDGIGLGERAGLGPGVGLAIMRSRAALAGGRIQLGRSPAGGTRVLCEVSLAGAAGGARA